MWPNSRPSHDITPWPDTAQICLNGHLINETAVVHKELNTQNCRKCGKPTITERQHCHVNIRGIMHYDPRMPNLAPYTIPMNCENCGEAYPWTVSAIAAARELVGELEISAEDKDRRAGVEGARAAARARAGSRTREAVTVGGGC